MTYVKAYTRQHDEFVADALAAIQPLVDDAAASAALAATLVAQEVGSWPANQIGLDEGVYWADTKLRADTTFTAFEGLVTSGTGTVGDVTIFINDYPEYGPVAISTAPTEEVISIFAPAGSTVKIQFSAIAGLVTSAKVLIRGSAA